MYARPTKSTPAWPNAAASTPATASPPPCLKTPSQTPSPPPPAPRSPPQTPAAQSSSSAPPHPSEPSSPSEKESLPSPPQDGSPASAAASGSPAVSPAPPHSPSPTTAPETGASSTPQPPAASELAADLLRGRSPRSHIRDETRPSPRCTLPSCPSHTVPGSSHPSASPAAP